MQVGKIAPEFTLYDSGKNQVSLADYKGQKVVLLFFPFVFSNVCTKELCQVRDNIAEFGNLDAVVFGISVDSLYALAKFKELQQINFQLLSDFNKEVSAAYGSLYETFSYGMKGVSKRSAFVIDETGYIIYAEILENSGEMPDFEAINKALNTLK
jgi:peroxiredoxin